MMYGELVEHCAVDTRILGTLLTLFISLLWRINLEAVEHRAELKPFTC